MTNIIMPGNMPAGRLNPTIGFGGEGRRSLCAVRCTSGRERRAAPQGGNLVSPTEYLNTTETKHPVSPSYSPTLVVISSLAVWDVARESECFVF